MPFQNMIAFIINFTRKSLQIELNCFTDLCNNKSEMTKQAFSKSRQNLSPETFELLNQELIAEFYTDNEIKTFKGFRVFGIDGSSIRLPESKELYEEYGSNEKQNSVPLAITSVLYDVLNHIAIHATSQPGRTPERRMALENILALCEFDDLINSDHAGDIIVFDRGYPWLFLMFFMQNKNKNFIMRCSSKVLSEVNAIAQSDARDVVITIPAFKSKRFLYPEFAQYLPHLAKDASIEIRILQLELSSGQKEVIVTSLTDEKQFTGDDLFELYGLRWNSEEAYKLYKCIAEIEGFSGKSKITVEQDFHATILTCNLASILMQEAQSEVQQERSANDDNACKYSYKINRNVLIGSMKNNIVEILLSDCDLNVYCEQFKKRIKNSLVPIRPNRSFPRTYRKREKSGKRRAL